MQTVVHPLPPLYDRNSEVLILGSFPSVASRQTCFFYGHPQNRFWRVIAAVTGSPVPQTVEEKTRLILSSHLALWDVIGQCQITGSQDSSIRQVVPNDIRPILAGSRIGRVFCNGATAMGYYRKYILPDTGLAAVQLPSTSPANAAWSLERLVSVWRQIRPGAQTAEACRLPSEAVDK